MSTKEFVIKDDNGKIYHPENLNEFKRHIKKYHSVDGVGDNSLHIEGRRFFTISKTFYENLMKI